MIELADTGQGIPEAAQAHLFEAFSGSTRPGGTGLGLPIAREIMRAHGGDIELVQTGARRHRVSLDPAGALNGGAGERAWPDRSRRAVQTAVRMR